MKSPDVSPELSAKKKGSFLGDVLFFGGLLAVMYVIRVVVMPAIGIPACSGGSCTLPTSQSATIEQTAP